MFKYLALAAIGFYQRHLSPRKGYSCAYRVHAGGMGCSGFGKHAISKHGLLLGLVLLRRRFAKCAWHAHAHAAAAAPKAAPALVLSKTYPQPTFNPYRAKFTRQGGFVDCDCSGCDVPASSCDVPSCDIPACDAPFGCGEGAGHASFFERWFVFDVCADACGSSSSSNCLPADCCGSGSGVDREEARRERARKRREEAGDALDDGIDAVFGDGDGDGD